MKIGSIGSLLARGLAAAGHQESVANSRGAKSVQAFADEIGATAADAKGGVAGADMIILSIPLPALANLPKDLFAQALPGEAPKIRDQLVTR